MMSIEQIIYENKKADGKKRNESKNAYLKWLKAKRQNKLKWFEQNPVIRE